MAKLPRLTPQEAEQLLQQSGFKLIRGKGSHRIYLKGNRRVVIPFHKSKTLHPKISEASFEKYRERGVAQPAHLRFLN